MKKNDNYKEWTGFGPASDATEDLRNYYLDLLEKEQTVKQTIWQKIKSFLLKRN